MSCVAVAGTAGDYGVIAVDLWLIILRPGDLPKHYLSFVAVAGTVRDHADVGESGRRSRVSRIVVPQRCLQSGSPGADRSGHVSAIGSGKGKSWVSFSLIWTSSVRTTVRPSLPHATLWVYSAVCETLELHVLFAYVVPCAEALNCSFMRLVQFV